MIEAVSNWLSSIFHGNPYVTTGVISIVPMIEVRGAITVGIGMGLNPWIAWVISCLSALIVCPLLLLCLRPLLKLLKKVKFFHNIAAGMEDMFKGKAKKITQDADEGGKGEKKAIWRKTLGVFLFVAVPLPLTGVWTGSAVAAFLDLDYKYSIPAIVVGNFVSGLIITLLNMILGDYSPIILLVLMIFVIVSIVSFCIAIAARYKKKNTNQAKEEAPTLPPQKEEQEK